MSFLDTLARETGLSIRDVRRIVASAPKRYKSYPIEKRNGGQRIIAQPAFELKVLQGLVTRMVLSEFPIHDSAYAYVRGRSIRQNAIRHVHSSHILKLDFSDFFHSIRPVDLERVLRTRDVPGISALDYETIYQIVFWGRGSIIPSCLSIGAPSSPMVSNVVMYDFDKGVSEIASDLRLTYTRYADDLTISSSTGQAPLLSFERKLNAFIERSPLAISLNNSKRGLYGRGERRMVTGLIITPNGAVSLGRERKRTISATLHRVAGGDTDERLLMRCKGLLAFVISAEPTFLRALIRKYGSEVVTAVLRAPQISFYHDEALLELD